MYQIEHSGALLKDKRQIFRSGRIWTSVGSTVFLLGITSLLTDVSSEMVSTTLPLYLLVTRGFSPFQVSVMDGIYQGAAVLVKVVSGLVADRWQRAKEVASFGYGVSALCKIGLLFAGSWTAISAVIVSDRLGKGIRTAPRDAMIAATSSPDQRATAFGIHRAMDTAGAMLGPLAAVAILSVAPQAYDAIFVVSLCVALIGLAVIVLFVENPADEVTSGADLSRNAARPDQPAVSWRSMPELLCDPEFRTLTIVGSALSLVTVSDGLLYLALRQRTAIPNGLFPLLYVITALSFMLLAIPAGRLADRIGAKVVFLLGYGLLGGVYGLLLLTRLNYASGLLLLAALGAYYAATDGVLMALASRILPAHLRNTGMALLTTGTGLARLFASTLYGAAWSRFGAQSALMLFGGGLAAVSMVAWFTLRPVGDN